jgi:hypothetical protein
VPAFEDIAEAAGLPKDLNKLTKEVLLKELEKRGCTTMTIKALKKDLVDALKTLLEDLHMRTYNDHNSENHLVANLASTSSSNSDGVVSVSSGDANDGQQTQQPRKASILAEFRSQVVTGTAPAAPVVDAAVQFEARLRRTSQGVAAAPSETAQPQNQQEPVVQALTTAATAAPIATVAQPAVSEASTVNAEVTSSAATSVGSAATTTNAPTVAATTAPVAPPAPVISPVKSKSPFRGSMLSPLAIVKRMMDISPAPAREPAVMASATAESSSAAPTDAPQSEATPSILSSIGSTTPFGKPAMDSAKRESDNASGSSEQAEFHDTEEGIAEPMDEGRESIDAMAKTGGDEGTKTVDEPEQDGDSPLPSDAVEDEANGMSLEDIISKNPESAAASESVAPGALTEESSKSEEVGSSSDTATAATATAAAPVASTPSSKSTLSLNIFTSKKPAATAEPVRPNATSAPATAPNPPNLLAGGATSFLSNDTTATKTTGLIKPTVSASLVLSNFCRLICCLIILRV